jgi:hypothetical protein
MPGQTQRVRNLHAADNELALFGKGVDVKTMANT